MKTIQMIFAACSIICSGAFVASAQQPTGDNPKPFTEVLMQDNCTFATTGRNTYSILEPGYQMVYQGMDGNDKVDLIITVTNQTRKIGNVETRMVTEDESVNGSLIEKSRNFFAFCKETSSMYYFGEEVDIYKDGKIVDHEGQWLAEGQNKPGVDMPGLALLGARFYQEVAPTVAQDRIEIISIGETYEVPAGSFKNCMRTEETSPLEPGDIEYKVFAPGVGLLQDEAAKLIKYGFVKQ
jgi:hypothetical protein